MPIESKKLWTLIGLTVRGLVLLWIIIYLLPGPAEALLADYSGDLDTPLPPRALGHYEYLKRHFEAPFEGYGATDVFVDEFAVVFLSHAAMGFLNAGLSDGGRRREVSRLLDEVARRALSPGVAPYKNGPKRARKLGDHNLYLSHLSLVLGARRLISGDAAHDALHRRISEHLANRSLAHGTAHARSYPGSPRFPADQAVVLASLHLYDLCHGTSLATLPVRRWQAYMRGHATHKETGLPISSLSPRFRNARLPRGCALSWTALYAAQFDPEGAFDLYTRYQRRFFTHIAGWGGFREYPPGVDGGMDVDSGPTVLGVGVAATGIGLGPARLFGDRRTYPALLRNAASVGLPSLSLSERRYLLAPLLGEAILFHGVTARRWEDGAPCPSVPDRSPPFPLGALILFLVVLGLAALPARKLVFMAKQGLAQSLRATWARRAYQKKSNEK